jgi:hypothetical protein
LKKIYVLQNFCSSAKKCPKNIVEDVYVYLPFSSALLTPGPGSGSNN